MNEETKIVEILKNEFKSLNLDTFFLIFNEIQDILTPSLAIEYVEKAYRYTAEFRDAIQMPSKLYFFYQDGDMRVMPSVVEIDGKKVSGIKIVSVHFQNKKRGLPVVIGFFVLVDSNTGALLCVIDATYLTAMRTGASGAVAVKHIIDQKQESINLGIIGCGVQARTQLALISCVKKIKEVIIYDISPDAMEKFEKFSQSLGFRPRKASSLFDFKDCDVVITITPSTQPFLMLEHVENVKLINAMGADGPGKQELSPEILKSSIVIVDNREQAIHGGEINVPLKKGQIDKSIIFGEIGEIIAGIKKIPPEKRVVFDSTGISILDVFVGYAIYKSAQEKGILKTLLIH
jgi:alanine dehydrogenase